MLAQQGSRSGPGGGDPQSSPHGRKGEPLPVRLSLAPWTRLAPTGRSRPQREPLSWDVLRTTDSKKGASVSSPNTGEACLHRPVTPYVLSGSPPRPSPSVPIGEQVD